MVCPTAVFRRSQQCDPACASHCVCFCRLSFPYRPGDIVRFPRELHRKVHHVWRCLCFCGAASSAVWISTPMERTCHQADDVLLLGNVFADTNVTHGLVTSNGFLWEWNCNETKPFHFLGKTKSLQLHLYGASSQMRVLEMIKVKHYFNFILSEKSRCLISLTQSDL